MGASLTQVRHLAGRSVMRVVRQPALIVPSLLFPLILLAVNASGLEAATEIPGFPTDSYITFALAFAFMQGAMFATLGAGQSLAEDVQRGFFNRLQLTPLRGWAMLAGQLAGVVVLGLVQATVYLSIGLLAGSEMESGPLGVLVLVALSVLISLAFGALGLLVALRSGSGEAVQGMFPLFFILLFLSSASLPRDLIANDWFQAITNWNPVSYMIEGMRSLFIDGWDAEALALGFGLAAVLLVAALAAASIALKGRMVRT
ncbi:MAG TPA: ABC transporter permease [Solirubrobacterales bacterium]